MFSLKGKNAVVTGGGSGIGQAIALAFAKQGARVDVLEINTEAAGETVEKIQSEGGEASAIECDVTRHDHVQEVFDKLGTDRGLDCLINNAGILSNNKAGETSTAEWRRLMSINLDGAFYLSREWLGDMKRKGWGRIVNICSLAAKTGGLTAGTAHTTSKGGMTALTLSLARESATNGVTVNGISPAYIKTPMVTEQLTEAQRQKLLAEIPVGRFCEGREVAHVVDFLVSPLSGFITGEIVDINGGLHMD